MRLKLIEPLKTSRMVRRDKERKRGRRGQRGEGEEPRRRRGVLGQTGEEAHTSFPSVLENKPADGRERQHEETGQRRGERGKVVKRSRAEVSKVWKKEEEDWKLLLEDFLTEAPNEGENWEQMMS